MRILVLLLFVAGMVMASNPDCTDGEMHRVQGQCSSYKVCVKGHLQQKNCWWGERYDPVAKTCKMWYKVHCDKFCKEGDLKPVQDDCAAYQECVDGVFVQKKCPSNWRFDPKDLACVDTGVASLGGCREYETCSGGKMVKTKCWQWMRYDPVWGQCRAYWKVNCNPKRECQDYDRRPVSGSCSDYEECQDGKFVKETCLLGKHFDAVTGTCVKPGKAHCGPQQQLETICRGGDKTPNPNDCQKYYECVDGQRIETKSCWYLMRFDPSTNSCRARWNVNCDHIKNESQQKPGTTSEHASITGSRQCDGVERRAVEGSCTDYEECQGGSYVRQTCLLGKSFDRKTLVCSKPSLVEC